MPTLQELTKEWLAAKADERFANLRRVTIEDALLQMVEHKEEGSITTDAGDGIKITTTGRLSYKVDVQMLDKLTMDWEQTAKPLKVKVEADETKLKKLRSEQPKLWAQIARAVEVKPQKTGVSISIEE
jgi:hypothetical protein